MKENITASGSKDLTGLLFTNANKKGKQPERRGSMGGLADTQLRQPVGHRNTVGRAFHPFNRGTDMSR